MEKSKCNYWDIIFQGLMIYRAEFQCAPQVWEVASDPDMMDYVK